MLCLLPQHRGKVLELSPMGFGIPANPGGNGSDWIEKLGFVHWLHKYWSKIEMDIRSYKDLENFLESISEHGISWGEVFTAQSISTDGVSGIEKKIKEKHPTAFEAVGRFIKESLDEDRKRMTCPPEHACGFTGPTISKNGEIIVQIETNHQLYNYIITEDDKFVEA